MQGPKKNSSHQLIITTMSCPMSARQRACRQPCPGPPGDDDFLNSGNCEISTVSTTTSPGNNDVLNDRLFHPRRHREPANQHNRGITSTTLSCTATVESQGKTDHGNLHLRHDRDDDEHHCGISTVFTQTATKNLHDLQTGTSTTRKHTATAESLWSSEQGKPWEPASAP